MDSAVQPRTKARRHTPRWSRSTKGCLTCHRRRKKCDERRPTCQGCERNCLLCSWPTQEQGNHNIEPVETPTEVPEAEPASVMRHPIPGSRRPQAAMSPKTFLAAMPSLLPPAYRDPSNSRLLDHFVHITAKRMAGRMNPENPFLTYNLQIAIGCEMMQHTILAISSSHLLYSDSNQRAPSRAHYAVALRGIKHALTRWDSAKVSDRLTLLATVLTLCWFEVIDVNMDGAIFHHLRASRSMLRTLLRDGRPSAHQGLLGFFAEQYAYLALVSNVGFSPGRLGRHLEAEFPCRSLEELNSGTQIYGCLFGCSHRLYQSIPAICSLARKRKEEGNRPSVLSMSEYQSLLETLLAWQPDPNSADPGFEDAGRMYQRACLIFLHTSFHGALPPTDDLFDLIDPLLEFFVTSFSRLSYESAAWTTVSWPVLVAGSCMRKQHQRDILTDVVKKSTFRMLAVENILWPLSLLWMEIDAGGDAYGPYGLEAILDRHHLNLCVG